MNVPKIRFNGFEEEWQENKLCDIARITMGQSPNSENYTNNSNDTLLIQGNADLNNGKVIPRLFTKQVTKTCDKNDIIMTVRAPVGDIAISDYNACIGRGVCSIKSSKFVYHYLDYLKMQDYWKKVSKGSTIDSITSDDIKSLLIKIPNKKEEEKIIKTIDLINKIIELQTKKIENLKLFTKKIFNETIKGKEYHEYRIEELFKVSAGGDIKKENVSLVKNDIYCYPIFSNNLENDGLYGYSNLYKIDKDSITVTGRGDIGKALCRKQNYYPIVRLLVLIPKMELNLKFYQECINNLHIVKESTGVPQLTAPQISNYKVIYPSIDFQNKIGKTIELNEKKFDLELSKLNNLLRLKKWLMQNMFV